MNKKYLVMGVAAMALCMVGTSCSSDVEEYQISEEDVLMNAERQLGFEIPEGQDWKMSTKSTASIAVTGDYDATYKVSIFQNNPFIDNTGVVLGQGSVKSGQTFNAEFVHPIAVSTVYVAIEDAKGYSYVKPAVITDGKLETTFGDGAAQARTRALTRASEADNFTIATRTQPDFSAYINDAVAITAENNTTNPSNTVRHYVIPAGTTWSDNIPLIQASDPNDESIVSVYVLGTLNVNAEQRINGGYGGAYKLIVGNGGVVNIASGVTLRSQANQGSGNVGEIHVMAGGKIQGAGKLEFSNGTNSFNYNGGSINVGTINNNGGTLYNAGTLEAAEMEGGAGLSIYENAGKVKIGKCIKGSSTANTRIHNNCWWEVTGDLYCRNIVQGTGAYIKAANLGMSGSEDGTGDPSYIYAKGNSLIDIPGYVAFNNVNIVGPTGSDYAYLQFGEATGSNRSDLGAEYHDKLGIAMNYSTSWDSGSEMMTTAISNNIRMSVDVINDGGNIYQPNPFGTLINMLNGTRSLSAAVNEWISELPVVGNGNAVLVRKGQYTAATVTESSCSPGVTILPPTPVVTTKPVWTFAFEDNTLAGDYDMNDVVLQVQENTAGDSLYVTLAAAGAEYDIQVYLNSTLLRFNGEDEVHAAFGVAHGVMVNTGGRSVAATPVLLRIAKPAGFDFEDDADFKIKPLQGPNAATNSYVRVATSGAPCGIKIPAEWAWPIERINIKNAYNDANKSFWKWAQSADHSVATDWYDYPTGSVVSLE